ncbi:Hsp33 family molecular chaperone [Hyphococcus flavus]|uniref:Hsp33 family molecular chaperone n=1 Tax=Hyphococcus flavus TaxID=1866326 RepID=A0AAE9ZF36_9PROT|nr:Hsp33 family molecular chaperone [Hyphococcus flavus]WDI32600.1 Hsp33 family molecular chaperone [Hyphococcus flavus]
MTDEAYPEDLIVPFQVADTAVRGRIVRLAGAIDDILDAHAFPDPVSELVGETVALVAMMGAALKFDGKLIFQAQGDGITPLVVADYSANGTVRATAKVNDAAVALNTATPRQLLGAGSIVMTIDQGSDMDRYQGVTPIEGETLAEAAVAYFDQSEQIPTAIKLAVGKVSKPGESETWRAGGVMAQFVPGEGGIRERGEAALQTADEREIWDRAAAFLETVQADELLDPSISAETLLYRLFHEDGVRVFDPLPVRHECSCNQEKITAVLSRYSKEDLSDMVEDGAITVSCEFCRKDYKFSPDGAPQADQHR